MKLERIEITNFRSIVDTVYLNERGSKLFTFVGATWLGSRNILRAINLFFTREVEPGQGFNPLIDLPQGSSRSQGKVSVTFKFTKDEDKRITTYIDKNHNSEFPDYRVPITLACFQNGNLQYSFTVALGRKKTLPDLLERIQDYVNCIYVPAIKDYRSILDSEMMRKIVAATFQGYGKGRYGSKTIGEQKEKFKGLLLEIQSVLDESGNFASDIISAVIPSIKKFSFSLPYDNLEDFLGRLLFNFHETHLIESIHLPNVGSGVQSFTIYSMLRLLHEIRPTNTHRKAKFLWLIEEPETFMHHDLQRKTRDKLREYAIDGHIFITTHSSVFIDKKSFENCYMVSRDTSTRVRPVNSENIREVIAGNLWVGFDDFLPFKRFNILVEGQTDKDLLTTLNTLFQNPGGQQILNLEDTAFLVCGAANSIPHFYHTYNVFNQYADFVALFDRDAAGIKARDELITAGVDPAGLLYSTSAFRQNNEIEDLADKSVWDSCIRRLDQDGLVSVVTQRGQINNYNYLMKDRVEVKKKFLEYLLADAKKNLSAFSKYQVLLNDLRKAIDQKRR